MSSSVLPVAENDVGVRRINQQLVSEPGVHQQNFGVFGHGSVYIKPDLLADGK